MAEGIGLGNNTNTPFARGFLRVISGSRVIEEFTQGMVSGAVREALEAVCDDYGLDIDTVRQKYEHTIVGKYSSISGEGSGPRFCEGKTATGKQCGRSATDGKFCKTHAVKENEAKRVRNAAEEYKERLSNMPKPKPRALYMGGQPSLFTQLDEASGY
jgi:hypothetical protein